MPSATLIAPASIGDYVIPTGWEIATIGDLFDIQQGKALSAAARTAIHRYAFLRTSNVLWGRINLSAVDSMGMSDSERSRLRLSSGDLLVCEGGDIGRAAVWEGEIADCYFQNHIHRLRPRDRRALPYFYAYWLQLAFTRLGVYEGAGTKTTIANLSRGRLAALEVPVPPLNEQRRIARILSTIQRARVCVELCTSGVGALKRSIVAQLFAPRKEWATVRLGDVITLQRGHDLPAHDREYGSVPVVSSSGITGYHSYSKAEGPGVVIGRYRTARQ